MAFFANAQNVDARNSTFTNVEGDQINNHPSGYGPRNPHPTRIPKRPPPSKPSYPQSRPNFSVADPKWILPEVPTGNNKNGSKQHPYMSLLVTATEPEKPIIHTTNLPSSTMLLDDELFNFETEISPWTNPTNWIQADTKHINSIIQRSIELTGRFEIEQARFANQDMIYPRLVLYLFIHLIECTNDKTSLNEFKEILRMWKTWDGLTIIQNHHSIRVYLHTLFQRLQSHDEFKLHSESLFGKLLTLDVVRLSAYLAITVRDRDKFKEVVNQRGLGAQSLVNLLQARLDFPINPASRRYHVKALIKLSRNSGYYPECLVLKGVQLGDLVTSGGYGDVYKGHLKGQLIAVKVLKISHDKDIARLRKEFSSEAVIWRQLSHPNILPFCGVFHLDDKTRRVCLVAPWLQNGNVVQFLQQNQDTDCVQLALDIAQGIEYLHEFLKPSIVHGDLKGFNVLVTPSGRACLADFGLATARDTQTTGPSNTNGGSGGTVRWQAPELHSPSSEGSSGSGRNSKASDIYALACVCYEMFSGNFPFCEVPYDVRVVMGVMSGRRPARPSHDLSTKRGLSDEVWHLVETCWAQKPIERPTATQVVKQLRALPNRPIDNRRFDDDLPIPAPSQETYRHDNHPFSALKPANEDSEEMQDLKWVSKPTQFDF